MGYGVEILATTLAHSRLERIRGYRTYSMFILYFLSHDASLASLFTLSLVLLCSVPSCCLSQHDDEGLVYYKQVVSELCDECQVFDSWIVHLQDQIQKNGEKKRRGG